LFLILKNYQNHQNYQNLASLPHLTIAIIALNRFFPSTRDNPIPNNNDQEFTLTSLISRETPTLNNSIAPLIQGLKRAKKAHDDAAFNLVINRIPQDYKVKIKHT
jgi:hypothetical protein